MKKIKLILFIICLITEINAQKLSEISTQRDSKQLIERYNKLRDFRSLPHIKHDSLLDVVSNEVLLNGNKYRKSFNSFIEDSIRWLFYNKGIIAYKYEINEVVNSDTSSIFDKELLADKSENIHVGFSRLNDKNLLIKYTSYFEYGYAEISCSSEKVDINAFPASATNLKIDSIKYHLKAAISGKYKYYYSNKIPNNSELPQYSNLFDIRVDSLTVRDYSNFKSIITSKYSDKYIVIIDEKNKIVAILK